MKELHQTDITGCRIIGAISKELGHIGPKHHGVVLGISPVNQEMLIAESMHFGYQVCTYSDFHSRYANNGEIIIEPNDRDRENISVARREIEELGAGGKGAYDLIINNCECFVNRVIHGKSVSNQVINTALGIAMILGLVYVLKKTK